MNIIGITSCTCGIAHTYMAREKLIETGKKLGWSVKIETQGSGGIEYPLTEDDVKNGRVEPIENTFQDLRQILKEK